MERSVAWSRSRWPLALIALLACALIQCAAPALALDTVRLGKAVPNSFAFAATEVGIEAKIFEREGLEIAVSSFRGDAQMQQALAAGSLDIGLGSGPGLGFRVKGAPAIGVAAMYGAPANLALLISAKSPIQSVADLKGKRIGVTTAGSLTDWLVRELSRQQGWGSNGIGIAALGQMQARLAAMDRGELDGMVLEAANGYELEEAGRTRNLILFGDIVKHFYTHVIFATDDMIEKRPDVLRRFLRGWFKTVAFMRANRDFAVKSDAAHARRAPEHRREDLRRPDRRLLRGRRLGSGGDRRDPGFAQGTGHPAHRPRRQGALQRQVRPGDASR